MEVPESPRTGGDGGAKRFSFSCLVCRQRKVRCDHVQPCTNCRRAQIDCEYVAPVRGKRKRTKPSRETMHARLQRYEDMLKMRGVDVDEEVNRTRASSDDALSESNGTIDSPNTNFSVPTPGDAAGDDAAPPMGFRSALIRTTGSGPKLVNREGSSRYYENSTLWTDISDDFRHPDEFVPVGADEDDENEVDLFLGPSSSSLSGLLRNWHPPLPCLHTLKDIFIDRVDPLMKMMHMPTFWPVILQAAQKGEEISRSMEAAVFCFYFGTISVIQEKECENLFKESKKVVFAKYRVIARHTLKKANLLSTSSPMTLRAFCLFMVCFLTIISRCDSKMLTRFPRWGFAAPCDTSHSTYCVGLLSDWLRRWACIATVRLWVYRCLKQK